MKKKYIKNMDEKELDILLHENPGVKKEKVPEELDKKLLNMIHNHGEKKSAPVRDGFFPGWLLSFKNMGLAAAFLVFIILTPILIFNLNKDNTPLVVDNNLDLNKKSGEVKFYRGEFLISRKGKSEKISLNSKINSGDTIKTGKASGGEIKVGGDSSVKVGATTHLEVASISTPQKGKTLLKLKEGKALFKIKKLNSGKAYMVRAGNLLVEVLGTEFLVDKKGKNVKVSVKEGKVKVTASDNKEYILKPMKALSLRVTAAGGQRVSRSTISSRDLENTFSEVLPGGEGVESEEDKKKLLRKSTGVENHKNSDEKEQSKNNLLLAKHFIKLMEYNNHTYYISRRELNWREARERCEAVGGHLVILDNPAEDKILRKKLSRKIYRKDNYWIGLKKYKGIFEWINEEDITFSNWASQTPANSNHQKEDYVYIWFENCTSGCWSDATLEARARYVLEIEK